MSIGKNQWPRDWIKRQNRWKDMDRSSINSCSRFLAVLCARSLACSLSHFPLLIQRNATAVAHAGMV